MLDLLIGIAIGVGLTFLAAYFLLFDDASAQPPQFINEEERNAPMRLPEV